MLSLYVQLGPSIQSRRKLLVGSKSFAKLFAGHLKANRVRRHNTYILGIGISEIQVEGVE
jgi:hypothetical protein